ncbi:MAG TPA: DUF2808 domain-containing protein [Thermosynechococcaceae cyanobacterium]
MSRYQIALGATIALSASIFSATSAQAVRLGDGKIHFVRPPQLLRTIATHKTAGFWSSSYYFTLSLPQNAGEPLQTVVISQQAGVDQPRLNLSNSEAFEGDNINRPGAKLPIQKVAVDRETQAITVTFDPPVSPGKVITIGLLPIRNPSAGGVYLYGVTAFPAGEPANGSFLGFGRITIYSDDF